jgi:hypothetical protein
MKKIKTHKGIRHHWGLKVRGQRTKTTGRRGATVGVTKKKWFIQYLITIKSIFNLFENKIMFNI